MLFASLINHLAVQQIREPHGNLISRSKGEEEENSGGKKESCKWQGHSILFPFFLQRSSGAKCVGVEWRECYFFFPFFVFLFAWAFTYPTNALLSLEHASVPVSL